MIKRLLFVFCILSVLVGCGTVNENKSDNGQKENAAEKEAEVHTADELDQILNKQEVHITKTKYTIQNEKVKILFPDMLQAIIKNDSTDKIKNIVISFVAWDKNNAPIKLKRSIDLSKGEYVRDKAYQNIDLASGATFGDDDGFGLNEQCDVQIFKAIIKSYETADGTIWENPQYDNWTKMYSGVTYSDSLSINGSTND